MGFDLHIQIPALTVFLQGLLSFFSPCVLPLIPLYIGYLAGGTIRRKEDGSLAYDRKKTVLHTLCFVLGVGTTFFALGVGAAAAGHLLADHRAMFARVGGIVVILFGLYQLGLFGRSMRLSSERRLPIRIDRMAMSPVTAFLMGFVFSFAWTPCVGPTLTSVLLMAASAETKGVGLLLIGVYTLGFTVPFLLAGIFAVSILDFFQKHRSVVRYTTTVGGVLMIAIGVMMLTGWMDRVSGVLAQGQTLQGTVVQAEAEVEQQTVGTVKRPEPAAESAAGAASEAASIADSISEPVSAAETAAEVESVADLVKESGSAAEAPAQTEQTVDSAAESGEIAESSVDSNLVAATDFQLTDQYGTTHRLSDYRGKIVFLNFWATWCPPCRAEMPDIQKLYEESMEDPDSDLVILGVASPGVGREKSEQGIADFLSENGYTYPTLMDHGGTLYAPYGITAFPTTYMIDKDGNVFGYIAGSLSEEIMREIIEQTRSGVRAPVGN